MKTIGKTLVICIAIILAGTICMGCSSPSSSTRNIGGGAAHPKEYYEGWWACCGYERDGTTVSFNNLSAADRATFPYLEMVLEEDLLGTVTQIKNGDGKNEVLLMGEWEVTGNGIRIDGAEFVLDGERLTAQQGDTLLIFEKCISGSQLRVDTIVFEDISFDAPVDLAYYHDAISPQSGNYGIANSFRMYGPSLMMSSKPTEAQDIIEMRDLYAGYEDCFTSYNGVNYFVLVDEKTHDTEVEFVSGGKLYRITFSYSAEDPVDYSDYAAMFYTTISIGSTGKSKAVNTKRAQAVPSGAITWQEASQHIGERVTVCGPVADADYYETSNGQPTFIDLGAAYPDASRVTVIIWGENRGAFPEPPEKMYGGKTVCVTGVSYLYNGVCNIEVTSPDQVQII